MNGATVSNGRSSLRLNRPHHRKPWVMGKAHGPESVSKHMSLAERRFETNDLA